MLHGLRIHARNESGTYVPRIGVFSEQDRENNVRVSAGSVGRIGIKRDGLRILRQARYGEDELE